MPDGCHTLLGGKQGGLTCALSGYAGSTISVSNGRSFGAWRLRTCCSASAWTSAMCSAGGREAITVLFGLESTVRHINGWDEYEQGMLPN